MAVMDAVLCNEPEVKRLALAALEECTDLQAFGRRCLEILLNSLVSAKADEACGAPYGERSPGRANPAATATGSGTCSRPQGT